MRINKYILVLLFNVFPSYSISAWFTSIFVQPRLFSLPFLFSSKIELKFTKWNLLLLTSLFITIFTPLIGIYFNRELNLMDLAYVISALYALLFVNKSIHEINLFNKFVYFILASNICYVVVQLVFYYTGFPELTMIHSNIPFHVNSQYAISPGLIPGVPRYTGLYVESGPLTFFLCLTFPYLIQRGVNFPAYLKAITLVLILLSQSKFLLLFLPVLVLEVVFKHLFPRCYRFTILPLPAFIFVISFVILLLTAIFYDFEFSQYLASTVPAYRGRLDGLRQGLIQLLELPCFGKGLLPSTFIVKDAAFELTGSDAISIVLLGYGLVMGTIMIFIYLLFPVLSDIDYKYTFIAVLILGLMSSGSLIVPQYLFAITYTVLSHYQNTCHCMAGKTT